MYLVEIFLPKRDNEGREFPSGQFSRVRQELVERFGGVTAFTREPAEGYGMHLTAVSVGTL